MRGETFAPAFTPHRFFLDKRTLSLHYFLSELDVSDPPRSPHRTRLTTAPPASTVRPLHHINNAGHHGTNSAEEEDWRRRRGGGGSSGVVKGHR